MPLLTALALVAGGGAAVVAFTGLDDGGRNATRPPSRTTPPVTSGAEHAAHTSSPVSAASSEPAPTTSVSAAGRPPAVAACTAEVKAGEAVAAAARPAAAHWRTHTSSQVLVDAGKISEAEAKKRWAASKKLGPTDVSTFTKADAAYRPTAGACARMGAVSGVDAAAAKACARRASALAPVAAAGRPIVASWSHHLEMMKSKPHDEGGADFGAYMTMWRSMVKQAGSQLSGYGKADKALDKAATCSWS
ncbi:hypothetical protein VV01_11300 [Luteipulveratus halotolerans]|uniref:Uncharacterized protein n=1 Tax=Luteipulveratus halotolerans TaxID=1631356 RepID=A0A0L6CIP2_9MICO|nr:hypothetical protein VV01_11300 [Luteipulveratus halotolerans]